MIGNLTMANDMLEYAEKLVTKLLLQNYLLESGKDIVITEKGLDRIKKLTYEIVDYRYTNKPMDMESYNALVKKLYDFSTKTTVSNVEQLIYLESQFEVVKIKHAQTFKKESLH